MEIPFATFRQEDKVDANAPPATKGSFLTGISAIRKVRFWPTAPIRGPISRKRRHPASLDPLLSSVSVSFAEAQFNVIAPPPPRALL
jgi:hypothetical protein